jgi:ubiquinone/menaquinone biosynthesis C-methylase UbiE
MDKLINHDVETSRRSREMDFHDQEASHISYKDVSPQLFFESPAAMENKFIARQMGPLAGKKILDLGTGTGEAAVYFATHGADTYICDISSGMIEFAMELGKLYGVKLQGKACPAEQLDFPDDFFDFVYLCGVLHHVSNRTAVYNEISRVLRPQGRFFAIEPLAGNPIINVYRRMADQVRSEDETPLTLLELQPISSHFTNTGHREFWFATLALFIKYYIWNRVHPNNDRYWKRIFKETGTSLWWWWPLRGIDLFLTRLPLLRNWCWSTVFWGQKISSAPR